MRGCRLHRLERAAQVALSYACNAADRNFPPFYLSTVGNHRAICGNNSMSTSTTTWMTM
jgi:hypothetical protein